MTEDRLVVGIHFEMSIPVSPSVGKWTETVMAYAPTRVRWSAPGDWLIVSVRTTTEIMHTVKTVIRPDPGVPARPADTSAQID